MGFIREVRNDIEREALRLMRGYYSMLLAEAKRASRRMAEAEFDASRIYGDYVRFACGEGTS